MSWYIIKYNYIYSIVTYVDINECTINNGGCVQLCTNTLGSYNCSCNSGYILDIDELNCTGIVFDR